MRGIVPPGSYTLRPPPWDWDFEVDGSLAVQPRRVPLQEQSAFVSVPRMPRASGHALVMRRRAEVAAARRKRRLAGLMLLAAVALVTLLLTAFGSGRSSAVPTAAPAPATRLLPAGPPRPQVVALQVDAPAPAPGRAEPRDGDRLPRLRTTARSRSTRSAGRRTRVSSTRVAQSLFGGGTQRPPLLRARRQRRARDRLARRRRGSRHRRLRAGGRHDRRDHARTSWTASTTGPGSTFSPAATRRSSSRSPTCGATRA